MDFAKYTCDEAKLLELYQALIKPRLIEEKMLKLLRQGQVSKWFSGIGQEAIAVGATMALQEDEYILPLHRNLGVFTSRNIQLDELFLQWKGDQRGFTKGRDRSFHFGSNQHHIVGMISHLGAMLGVADGIALGNVLDKTPKVTLAFTGDGGTSEGDFHEAVNLAAVWDLPVIFIVESNGYGLSTPSVDQFRVKDLADKAIGYGIDSIILDGNNILEVFFEVSRIAQDLRKNPRPILVECKTFRRRGHEEASGVKYVPKDLISEWEKKDPISNFEDYLINKLKIDDQRLVSIQNEIKTEIQSAIHIFTDADPDVDVSQEISDVYKPAEFYSGEMGDLKNMRFIDAVKLALEQAMEQYDKLVIMGQDIAEYGGVFKITDGFVDRFGKDRVRNTPISESAPLGAALGLSIAGKKSIVEMQFADFVSCGFNQIVNNLAKTHYRWGQEVDTVIRMPTGAGAAAGPFHSQSNEAWFFHVPGLKIAYPSSARDAKSLLLAAIDDPNPVLFFEHKFLYRNVEGRVDSGSERIELGKASFVAQGDDITLISYGLAVHWCKNIVKELELNATILDLRSLIPWDKEAVKEAVQMSGKVMIVHEDNLTGGIGAEISAWIAEHCFENLDAPVMRTASLDTPIPFKAELEQHYLASSRLKENIQTLINY